MDPYEKKLIDQLKKDIELYKTHGILPSEKDVVERAKQEFNYNVGNEADEFASVEVTENRASIALRAWMGGPEFKKLPSMRRQIFMLVFVKEWTENATAQHLNITQPAVSKHVQALRRQIGHAIKYRALAKAPRMYAKRIKCVACATSYICPVHTKKTV